MTLPAVPIVHCGTGQIRALANIHENVDWDIVNHLKMSPKDFLNLPNGSRKIEVQIFVFKCLYIKILKTIFKTDLSQSILQLRCVPAEAVKCSNVFHLP